MVDRLSDRVGIGLIGAGFMGKCHANAFRSVGGLFDLPCSVELDMLADIDADTATATQPAGPVSKKAFLWVITQVVYRVGFMKVVDTYR